MAKQVFLSYSTDDSAIVTAIRDQLEMLGITCWIAPRDITPGDDYADQIITAIESTKALVLILSESSNRSSYVRNEVERAVAKGKVIIPFRIHRVEPSRSLEFFISNRQWIEAWEPPLDVRVNVLAEAIRTHLENDDNAGDISTATQAIAIAAPATPVSHFGPHNLQRQTTPFVGRERELAQIDEKLADPAVGLVTIVGLGGMGKTRLSIEAAGRQTYRFSDGVWFVPLASVDRAELLSSTIANVLNLAGYSGSDPDEHLLRHLADKNLLLVLDNFEHLLNASDLISRILVAGPGVKLLVTSRVRLQLQEEWLLPLEGLDVPRSDDLEPFDLTLHSAVELFVQRARRLQPDFVDDAANLAHVVQICRLVGGMPLGIELAVSWLRTIPLAEIASEVQSSLNFLATSMRNMPEEHRNMRAVFYRSWRLLSTQEQQVLAFLSTFRGGFTREATTKVADASIVVLSSLMDSSWLQRGIDGRYTLHELVRQYATEQLASVPGASKQAQQAHAEFYGMLAEGQTAHFGTKQQKAAIELLMADVDNIRAGWQWAVANLDVELIGKYVECLKWMADTRSLYLEVVPEFERASAVLRKLLAQDSTPHALRQESSFVLGLLLHHLAYIGTRAISAKQALPLAVESLRLLRGDDIDAMDERHRRSYLDALVWTSFAAKMGGAYGQAVERSSEVIRLAQGRPQYAHYAMLALFSRAMVAHEQGRFEEAGHLYREFMSYPGIENSSLLFANVPWRLAMLDCDTGNLERASQMVAEATTTMEQDGSWALQKDILALQARIAMQNGELERAKQLLAQVGSIAERTGAVTAQLLYLLGGAQLARLSVAPGEAQRLYGEAEEVAEQSGRSQYYEQALVGLGYATLDQGALQEAREHFSRALHASWEIGLMPEVIAAVVGFASLKALAGGWEEAVEWLAVAVSHPACVKETQDEVAKILAQLNAVRLEAPHILVHNPNPEQILEQIVERLLALEVER